jgi:hypothetical protein
VKTSKYGRSPTDKQHEELLTQQRRLQWRLEDWSDSLHRIAPQAASHTDFNDSDEPHKEPLPLPSYFSAEDHENFDLEELTDVEIKLRIAHSHEALTHLRDCLGLKSFLVRAKAREARGVRAVTRSEGIILRTNLLVVKWTCYDQMIRLFQNLSHDYFT